MNVNLTDVLNATSVYEQLVQLVEKNMAFSEGYRYAIIFPVK